MTMLGGRVGDQTMQVADAPTFKVGNRDILFVEHNGDQFIPIVGIMYGRFRIEREAQVGRDIVTTDDHRPVHNVAELGEIKPQSIEPTKPGLSISDFKAAIIAKL